MLPKILALILICEVSLAGFSAKTDVGVGHTSNANFDKNDPQSDAYYKYGLSPNLSWDDFRLSGSLSYQDYSVQNLNDEVSWKLNLGYESEIDESWAWNGEVYLLSNQFVNGSPETGDQNYSNSGVGVVLGGEYKATDNISAVISPGFETRKYQDSVSRTEKTVFLKGELEYSLDKKSHFEGELEGGSVDSNEDSYVRRYGQFGISGVKSLSSVFGLGFNAYLKRTTYGKRKYGGGILDRRGRTSTGSSESTTLIHLELDLNCQIMENFSMALVADNENQTSASNNYDYKVNEILLKAIYKF